MKSDDGPPLARVPVDPVALEQARCTRGAWLCDSIANMPNGVVLETDDANGQVGDLKDRCFSAFEVQL